MPMPPGGNEDGNRRDLFSIGYASYDMIFPRASLIVHQGGIGTLAQSMMAQRPMLVVPFGFDQFDNGETVEKLGIGKSIPRKNFIVEAAAPLIEELLTDSSYQRNAIKTGATINKENGILRACEAIEHQLNKH